MSQGREPGQGKPEIVPRAGSSTGEGRGFSGITVEPCLGHTYPVTPPGQHQHIARSELRVRFRIKQALTRPNQCGRPHAILERVGKR